MPLAPLSIIRLTVERFLSMTANLDRNGLIAVVAVLLNLPMCLTPV